MKAWLKRKGWMLLLLALLLLTGCAKPKTELTLEEKDQNTLLIKEDGTVESLLVEDFAGYSETELNAYLQEQIDTYNGSAGAGMVQLKELTVEDGKAILILSFQNGTAVEDFYELPLTILSGSELAGKYHDVLLDKKGKEVSPEQAFTSEYVGVLLDEIPDGENPYRLMLPKKIAFYAGGELTDGFTLSGDGDTPMLALYKK